MRRRDGERIPEAEFWANEFTPGLPVPTRIEDLVIYELHVNALGFGENRAGNLQDALRLLPHLSDLGVNAVEHRDAASVALADKVLVFVIAFTRSAGSDRLLVVASLQNQPFLDGYVIQTDTSRLPDGLWREAFNSDASIYGGNNIGNFGADVPAMNGRIQCRIPANGFLVFQRL